MDLPSDEAARDRSAPAAAANPSDGERDQVVGDIVHAVDEGLLDPGTVGGLLSSVYRATDRRDLRAIADSLTVDRSAARGRASRRERWWSVAYLVVFAVASAILVVAVLHGVSPTDPH